MYSCNYAGGRRAIGVLVQMKLEWDQFQWGLSLRAAWCGSG